MFQRLRSQSVQHSQVCSDDGVQQLYKTILFYHQKGYKAPTIHQRLISVGIPSMRENIHRFLQRFEISGVIHRKPGSGHLLSITTKIKVLVVKEMQHNDETQPFNCTNYWCHVGIK